MKSSINLSLVIASLCAPVFAKPAPVTPPIIIPPTPDSRSDSKRLQDLFHSSDEAFLRRSPLHALVRGDLRYSDRFGDYITDDYYAAEKAAAVADLKTLQSINRNRLTRDEQISYDVFKWQTETKLAGLQPDILAATIVRPLDHMEGLQVIMPDLSSGHGAAPFNSISDYESNLHRLDGYAIYLSRAVDRMRQGIRTHVVQPRLVSEKVLQQVEAITAQGVEGSAYYKPVLNFPKSIPPNEQTRLRAAYQREITDVLLPAHEKLRRFLIEEYLPASRDSVGLSAMPGGDKLYRYLVHSETTTDMSPEAIHRLGLAEMKRIRAEMEHVKNALGFRGTLSAFQEFVRTDPRFKPTSANQLKEMYEGIRQRVQLGLPRLFSTMPRTPLEIRPVSEFRQRTAAAANYSPGSPDGSRPGIFFYNTYDLPSRSIINTETLFLHEAIPGHHFQASLAQENDRLPPFQRFDGNTAYVEGWGLYAESLGSELGLYKDQYQLFGHLNDEMWRAMRLVVDTGLHEQGWSRDQAISFMLANSATSRTTATVEVERYISIPGQALSYKIGELTIRRLRTQAQRELGRRFNVRDFHAQVLSSGALPLAVLEHKISDWIRSKKRG